MIQSGRIVQLNDRPAAAGHYVLYWMQQSQRASSNPALEYAIGAANEMGLPVVVGFGLMADYPDANRRHFAFMLEGLQEVARTLAERQVGFVIRRGRPDEVALDLAADAALMVCDRGYLRHQKAWRKAVADGAPCRVIQVEGDAVVPVDVASQRQEIGARTLRPKLHRVWDEYLADLDETTVYHDASTCTPGSNVDLSDLEVVLDVLDIDGSVAPVRRFQGGTSAARARLQSFLDENLAGYAEERSEPGAFRCSLLSPYLHFGQISPVEIALAVRDRSIVGSADRLAYLEELIVRRELAINFVHFSQDYDSFACLPEWARATLDTHRSDRRPEIYDRAKLEAAKTHDPYWNAAMREMVHTGFMHNYMRMYWAKKILEWSATPEEAFVTALHLDNRYFLDGRDPNSYAGVAWTFGLHDRPWPERPVFGKIRYMNANGLKRKFDMKSYLLAVDRLVAHEETEV